MNVHAKKFQIRTHAKAQRRKKFSFLASLRVFTFDTQVIDSLALSLVYRLHYDLRVSCVSPVAFTPASACIPCLAHSCFYVTDAIERTSRQVPSAVPVIEGLLMSLAKDFKIVPRPLRDRAYLFIASHRYQWFGKHDQCMVPRPEWRDRFLA